MKGNRPPEHYFAVRRPWLTAFVAATYERRGRCRRVAKAPVEVGDVVGCQLEDVSSCRTIRPIDVLR
jgi:hypothetical protein